MSAVPEGPRGDAGPGLPAGVCPVCGGPVDDVVARCPDCGCDLAGVPPRPPAFSRPAVVATVAAFVAVYAVIVAAVALVN